ncbi:MAG TPA: cobalamin biosynthesis protein [Kofleriaceae bacterium]|nr:cobalamin biosynthesis protein [Kofleriaceae bacterium]
MTARRPYAVYAITRHGVAIAARLAAGLPGADVLVPEKLHGMAQLPAGARALPLPIGPFLATAFAAYDCHVFVISVGAVVRLIAPLLVDKKVDPAVVCVDDDARFAICVLSGHVGRGNAFTARVAGALSAQPVITTASDVRGTLTVDILGRELGWQLDDPDRNVTRGCAAVVNAAPVAFVQETGEPTWWPEAAPLPEGVSYATTLDEVDPARHDILLVATDRELRDSHPAHWARAVIYRPKSLVLGLGCDRGVPTELVERGIAEIMARHALSPRSVKAIATIDKKRDEAALIEIARRLGCPLVTYAADELDCVPGIISPSDIVKRHVGTRGVAEPAALLAAGGGTLIVPKQRYTEPGAGRAMTLAIARIRFPPRRTHASLPALAAASPQVMT